MVIANHTLGTSPHGQSSFRHASHSQVPMLTAVDWGPLTPKLAAVRGFQVLLWRITRKRLPLTPGHYPRI